MAMAKTASLNIRVEPEIKRSVDGILANFGMTATEAVNIFLHKIIMSNGIPFDLIVPPYNEETLAAMQEARDIMSGKIKAPIYGSVAEMNAALDAEDDEV